MPSDEATAWRLLFDKRVYNLRAVRKAVKAFGHLARFQVRSSGNFIEVSGAGKNARVCSLPDEFANYVLGVLCQGGG
ncbi:MAG: hypothetical protein HQL20_01800 [Candidatus Omnitrophica bacterium]|nr:hypothetical protein [Candidatus Omnitrophota bacterium]